MSLRIWQCFIVELQPFENTILHKMKNIIGKVGIFDFYMQCCESLETKLEITGVVFG